MVRTVRTRATLLTRIKDEADADAWRELVRLYGPVVYGFALRRGLPDADAADLMREVLRGVARNAETMEYDPGRGTFSGWLCAVTRNKIDSVLSARKNRPRGSGDDGPRVVSRADGEGGAEPDSDWDAGCQRQLAAEAMNRTKHEFHSSIWQAFWKTVVDGRPARDVGVELDMTFGAVYVARSRVLARLGEEVQRLRAEAEAW